MLLVRLPLLPEKNKWLRGREMKCLKVVPPDVKAWWNESNPPPSAHLIDQVNVPASRLRTLNKNSVVPFLGGGSNVLVIVSCGRGTAVI